MAAKLTKAEVARFLEVSPTRVAYAISRGWLRPVERTAMGTELYLLDEVLQHARERGIVLVDTSVRLAEAMGAR